jgi:hypothetical protein
LRRIAYSFSTVQNRVNFRLRVGQVITNGNFIVAPGTDPRTAAAPNGIPLKYFTGDADITLIKWQEMHLILAEAAWRDGDLGAAVEHINAIRTAGEAFTIADGEIKLVPFELPAFEVDPSAGAGGATDQVRDQIIYERAAEFWLEGLRWADARRYLDAPFNGPAISPWPPAEWVGGADPRQTLPIGITELRQNPNLR